MDERTSDHLRTARANRVYALAIVNDDAASTTELNWAAVAAFYAAMHAINAYLWETARLVLQPQFIDQPRQRRFGYGQISANLGR